jgi:hypothetical protein
MLDENGTVARSLRTGDSTAYEDMFMTRRKPKGGLEILILI